MAQSLPCFPDKGAPPTSCRRAIRTCSLVGEYPPASSSVPRGAAAGSILSTLSPLRPRLMSCLSLAVVRWSAIGTCRRTTRHLDYIKVFSWEIDDHFGAAMVPLHSCPGSLGGGIIGPQKPSGR